MEQSKIDKINKIIDSVKPKIKFLECDGATRVMDYLLTKNGIKHTVMVGKGSLGKVEVLHFWIEIEDMKLDLKSKMWFGDEATEGLFKDSKVKYVGNPTELNVTDLMFAILMS